MSIIRNPSLAKEGEQRIEWASAHMPLLAALENEYRQTLPLKGKKVAVSVHLEAKTARLGRLLAAAGAEVAITGSNVLTTRDEICAALAAGGLNVYAWYNATQAEYMDHLRATLAFGPDLIIDDGGDFLQLLHGELSHLAGNIIGGCEETTTGVMRMRAREREGTLRFPMIAINDADCKHLFDNRFGTGQSTWDGIMRATNLVLPGKVVVVAGFGHCGRGVAEKARGLGSRVVVTEVDPVAAIEAAMDGYVVMPMAEAAKIGDIFVTLTGCKDVITKEHFKVMKDGVLLANAGHFDVEINKIHLAELAESTAQRRKDVMGFTMPDGRVLNLLADGRLVNIVAGDGHPVEIMDMSFALQALSVVELATEQARRTPKVYDVSKQADSFVANLKLQTLGLSIDALTPEQKEYLEGAND